MKRVARIGHHMDGRVRLYVPRMKGALAYFAEVREVLCECELVDDLRLNPKTGSILVHYTGSLGALLNYAQTRGLFDVVLERKEEAPWQHHFFAALNKVDKKVGQATGGDMTLSNVTALALIVCSVIQIRKRQILPAATALISEAMRILITEERSKKEIRAA